MQHHMPRCVFTKRTCASWACELAFNLVKPRAHARHLLLVLVLLEAVRDQVLHVVHAALPPLAQVQQRVVRQLEPAHERCRLAADQRFCDVRRELVRVFNKHHDVAAIIFAAPPRAAGHLDVFATGEGACGGAIVFDVCCEEHRARRHVEAHSERLCGKQHLDQALLRAQRRVSVQLV